MAESFSLDLVDADGEKIERNSILPLLLLSQRALYSKDSHKIPSNASTSTWLILNWWWSTMLPVGKYRIDCRFRDCGRPSTGSTELRATSVFEIVALEEAELRNVFQATVNEFLKREFDMRSQLALNMLTSANSPVVVPFLGQVLNKATGVFAAYRPAVVEAIGRFNTLEAANLLVPLVKDKDKAQLTRFDKKVILAIYQMNDRAKDADVRRACKDILDQYDRPRKTTNVD